MSGHRERHVYRGYTIIIHKYGAGWRAQILAPDNGKILSEPPYSNDPTGRKEVLAEARKIVDDEIKSASEK